MTETARILLYSDDRTLRQAVSLALGTRVAADLPPIEIVEVATHPVVETTMDAGGIDLVILDGEAVPAGGMGIARQLKDEIDNCPPILLLVARIADAWLATWSRADAICPMPIDPVALPAQVAELLRKRLAAPSDASPDAASETLESANA